MPRRRKSVAPLDSSQVLTDRMDVLEKVLRTMQQAQAASVQVVDTENFNDPVEGMTVVDWPTGRFCYYHDNKWICFPAPVHAIKVYADTKLNKVAAGAFRFAVEADLDGWTMIAVSAFNGTKGTSSTVVQISLADKANDARGIDLLTTPITIVSGNHSSDEGGVQPVIDPNMDPLQTADMIWINVDTVGSGSKGLGVYIMFAPSNLDNTI